MPTLQTLTNSITDTETSQQTTTTTTINKMTSVSEEAKQRLQQIADNSIGLTTNKILNGGFFGSVTISSISISHCSGGRILCSFLIPQYLTDGDGNWEAGAIAAIIDVVGAFAVKSVVGHLRVSVDFSISYFSPAKINEEVEIDASVTEHKEKMTAVTVEVRNNGNRTLVALGRQWMTSALPNTKSRSSL